MEFIPGYREANAPMRGTSGGGDGGGTGGGATHSAGADHSAATPAHHGLVGDRETDSRFAPASSSSFGSSVTEDSWNTAPADRMDSRSTPPSSPRALGVAATPGPSGVHDEIEVRSDVKRTHVLVEPNRHGGRSLDATTQASAVVVTTRLTHGARASAAVTAALSLAMQNNMGDAPACDGCGAITVRSGTCYKCLNCGNSMGCS